MMINPKVVVVGSCIMDFVVKAKRRPNKGETIVGESFNMYIGGKGANQAIAAARLGATVHMVGCVGNDDFGKMFINRFKKEKINTNLISCDLSSGTGIGAPVIDSNGDNSIIIIPRANMMLSERDIDRAKEVIAQADILILQLEIPINISLRAAEVAKDNGTIVLLNPAPACVLPKKFLGLIDILIPNETEVGMLTGLSVSDDSNLELAAEKLLSYGIDSLIITLGERGSILFSNNHATVISPYVVNIVDTTGAGDSYCGSLATMIAKGKKIEDAVKIASACGALAVTKMGAEPSMPTRNELERFMS